MACSAPIHGIRGHGALDDKEICAPVSERQHKPKPHGHPNHSTPSRLVCAFAIPSQECV